MRIIMIGAGNAATVLCRCIIQSGHEVIQVFSRSRDHAASLAKELNTPFTNKPEEIQQDGDIYIAAIPDNALGELGKWLYLRNQLIVHTAGSMSIRILENVSKNHGVLYPLQTLNKQIKKLPRIPFLIDGNTVEDRTLLFDFAKSLSDDVTMADDQQRIHMHLAAVIVNNFTNHLFDLAQQLCNQHKLDFNMLMPLIEQTVSRLNLSNPADLQTGPAVRKDQSTIEKHLQLLENNPDLQKLYKIFTSSIQSR